MRVRFSLAAFMPRPKKTSTQPKRKVKKFVDKPKPVYPEFIQSFINKVQENSNFLVKVDQYAEGNSYHVAVNIKNGSRQRTIWMVGFATSSLELNVFWNSEAYKVYK
jgi:hypothetical protein